MTAKERQQHPSYGLVSISRFSTPCITLFDSPFVHRHGVTLSICRATKHRDLNRDVVHGDAEIIRVAMSEIQFANLITSANVGCGASCTIERLNGERVEDPPKESMRETFKEDVKTAFKDLEAVSKELDDLINKKDAKAEDRRKMRDLSGQINMALKSNLAYMQEQFEEQIEKAVAVAKAEIQAHAESVVKLAGLQAIAEKPEQHKLLL